MLYSFKLQWSFSLSTDSFAPSCIETYRRGCLHELITASQSSGGQPRKMSKETLKLQYQIQVQSIQVHMCFWLETTVVFLEDLNGIISLPSVSGNNTIRSAWLIMRCVNRKHTYWRWLSSCSNCDRTAKRETKASGPTGKQFNLFRETISLMWIL